MFRHTTRVQALFPLGLLLLAVAACEEPAADSESSSAPPPVVESTPAEAPLTVDDPDAVPAAELTGMALALSGEGILVVDQQSGNTQTIPFETDLETSQTAVSAALGDPENTSENDECGAGPMSFVTWSNGFTINAMEDQFVGWSLNENTASGNLTTVAGVGLGSTLEELEENYDVGVIESSLGTEFIAANSLFG
ncbi:MAG: hypothetical protein ACFB2W_26460 [Leptolyngbyaceae cyanobacterium]